MGTPPLEIVHCPHPDQCYAALAEVWRAVLERAIGRQGYATIALSGGQTPKGLFAAISRSPLARADWWSQIYVFFVDERVVPPDHPESNFGMARQYLLDTLPLAPSRIFRMPVDIVPLAEAARQYRRIMAEVFAALPGHETVSGAMSYPVFDLMMLGMGRDGHTASLFSAHPALSRTEWVVEVEAGDAVPPVPRLSLSLPVINSAETVIFLISGEEKIRLARSFLNGPQRPEYPASLVRPLRKLWWFMVD